MFFGVVFLIGILLFGILDRKRTVRLGWVHPSSLIIGSINCLMLVVFAMLDPRFESAVAMPFISLFLFLFFLSFLTVLLDLSGRLPRVFWSREDKENFRMRSEGEGQLDSRDLEGRGDG